MKKTWLLITILLNVSLIPFTQVSTVQTQDSSISATKTQDTPTSGNGVTIYSPCNRTYNRDEVIAIKASSATLGGANIIYEGTYTIDDGAPHKLNTESLQTHSWDPFFGALVGTATLPTLTEGTHKLTVYLKTYIETTAKPPTMSGEATVYFTIGDNVQPSITLEAVDGVVFNQTLVPLNFTINEPAAWTAYRLDNGTLMDIAGNTTLTVASGSHSIVLYANDTAGNMGQSGMAQFSVRIPEVALAQQPWGLIAFVLVVIVTSFIIALFYRQKRRENEP
ncbi:MAG: hypothetical protein NWE96_05670 [Candidatus Bathyarchaeota archaeon]|nr:hypothetical protein [Candidatus Bathyarchaeota archaeon]